MACLWSQLIFTLRVAEKFDDALAPVASTRRRMAAAPAAPAWAAGAEAGALPRDTGRFSSCRRAGFLAGGRPRRPPRAPSSPRARRPFPSPHHCHHLCEICITTSRTHHHLSHHRSHLILLPVASVVVRIVAAQTSHHSC